MTLLFMYFSRIVLPFKNILSFILQETLKIGEFSLELHHSVSKLSNSNYPD